MQKQIPHLPDLIGFCESAVPLQVRVFRNVSAAEDMVASPCPHFKPQTQEQATQVVKRDVGIVTAPQNPVCQFLPFAHTGIHPLDGKPRDRKR
jgi:hypothetical protein